MERYKIATINARGLNNTKKRLALFQWIEDNSFDIVYIQETYCTPEFVKRFDIFWKGKIFHSNTDSKHSRGVSILLSKNFNGDIISCVRDNVGRKLLLNICDEGSTYTLVNLYCPNSLKERIDFLQNC